MDGTRDEYIEKLLPMFQEVHTFRLQKLKDTRRIMRVRLAKLEAEIFQYESRTDDVEHNLGRATDTDLKGCHFIFFGEEGRIKMETET